MTIQEKIRPLLENIKSIVSKNKPAIFQLEGYAFEIHRKYMIIKYDNFSIMYKSKRGFSQEDLEAYVNDSIKYFKIVKDKKTKRLKKK